MLVRNLVAISGFIMQTETPWKEKQALHGIGELHFSYTSEIKTEHHINRRFAISGGALQPLWGLQSPPGSHSTICILKRGFHSHPKAYLNWIYIYIIYIYHIYIYTWNPNDPCFGWKRPCFGGLTFKNRGQLGSRYTYGFSNNQKTCKVKARTFALTFWCDLDKTKILRHLYLVRFPIDFTEFCCWKSMLDVQSQPGIIFDEVVLSKIHQPLGIVSNTIFSKKITATNKKNQSTKTKKSTTI